MVEINIQYPLTPDSANELREPVLSLIMDAIKSVHEHVDGFTLNFGRESSVIKTVCQLIELERVLNPFLRLVLMVESNQGPIKLDITGPAGTKDFLISDFGLKRWLA